MKKLIILLLVLTTVVAAQAQDLKKSTDQFVYGHRVHVLNREEFARVQQTVKNTPFADDKKIAFKAAMQRDYITTAQVQDLLKQFVFDDDKLSWIILTYPYVADVQYFYRIRNDLTFITSQNKFDQFLQSATDMDQPRQRIGRLFGREEFADLQAAIRKEPFADGKKKIFSLALNNRLITVAQLSELLKQFTFDDDKLAWAFIAYKNVADVQRYYQVRNLLTFDMNKQKLDKFLLEAGE
jgi:hypothetical protein